MNYIKMLIIGGVMLMTVAAGAHMMNVAKSMQAARTAQLNEIMEQL